MSRLPGQARSKKHRAIIMMANTPAQHSGVNGAEEEAPQGRRILPSGPGGWTALVVAVTALVGALTELAKVMIGG